MSTTSRSPAVKRLMSELRELQADTSTEYVAQPLDDNLFEWHFTVRGPEATAFEGGIYHGRILLPAEYPFKPPSIIFLTPNGRFRVNEKICLSVTGFHPEFWRPAWGIRTVLLALLSFMPTRAEGAVGALEVDDEGRRREARISPDWTCPHCKVSNRELLPPPPPRSESSASGAEDSAGTASTHGAAKSGTDDAEAKELIAMMRMDYEGERKAAAGTRIDESGGAPEATAPSQVAIGNAGSRAGTQTREEERTGVVATVTPSRPAVVSNTTTSIAPAPADTIPPVTPTPTPTTHSNTSSSGGLRAPASAPQPSSETQQQPSSSSAAAPAPATASASAAQGPTQHARHAQAQVPPRPSVSLAADPELVVLDALIAAVVAALGFLVIRVAL
ncbi:UBC-like protein [Gonapodya prolifera JEL478]|uniref:UBC-like protein n=1 Tax=Gonapodya prolifera (strain JEL478) TaxID=1344416 RepID=A0A139ADW9_GONPJ|nr:UBC-like protein [Gonapodya prolifera JEL478]|eukprot:KXS14613.1 UBC-like protein [Gonapodya prolifera JEL478]